MGSQAVGPEGEVEERLKNLVATAKKEEVAVLGSHEFGGKVGYRMTACLPCSLQLSLGAGQLLGRVLVTVQLGAKPFFAPATAPVLKPLCSAPVLHSISMPCLHRWELPSRRLCSKLAVSTA